MAIFLPPSHLRTERRRFAASVLIPTAILTALRSDPRSLDFLAKLAAFVEENRGVVSVSPGLRNPSDRLVDEWITAYGAEAHNSFRTWILSGVEESSVAPEYKPGVSDAYPDPSALASASGRPLHVVVPEPRPMTDYSRRPGGAPAQEPPAASEAGSDKSGSGTGASGSIAGDAGALPAAPTTGPTGVEAADPNAAGVADVPLEQLPESFDAPPAGAPASSPAQAPSPPAILDGAEPREVNLPIEVDDSDGWAAVRKPSVSTTKIGPLAAPIFPYAHIPLEEEFKRFLSGSLENKPPHFILDADSVDIERNGGGRVVCGMALRRGWTFFSGISGYSAFSAAVAAEFANGGKAIPALVAALKKNNPAVGDKPGIAVGHYGSDPLAPRPGGVYVRSGNEFVSGNFIPLSDAAAGVASGALTPVALPDGVADMVAAMHALDLAGIPALYMVDSSVLPSLRVNSGLRLMKRSFAIGKNNPKGGVGQGIYARTSRNIITRGEIGPLAISDLEAAGLMFEAYVGPSFSLEHGSDGSEIGREA